MEVPAWTPEAPLGSMQEHSVMQPSCSCQSSLLFFSNRCCFPSSRRAETRQNAYSKRKRNYILFLRVKEGHGAGERQRSESGLGNADIDVSHQVSFLLDIHVVRCSQDEMDAADFLTADFQRVNISGEDKSSLNRSCTGVYISTR